MRRAIAALLLGALGAVAFVAAALAGPGPGGPAGEKPVVGSVIPYVIVHDTHKGKEHGNGNGPPGGGGGGDGGGGDHSTHYVTLPGHWGSTTVDYVVEDPGIPGALQAVQSSFGAWNQVSGINFVYRGTQAVNPNAEVAGPNGTNTVSWALLTGSWSNALAVTTIWIDDADGNGVWNDGEPVVENDLFFNSKFKWAVDPDGEGPQRPDVRGKWYDVQNVGTHEAGHFVGLDDQTQWDDETMYASAGSGEVKKRSLEPGDIAGAQALYGP